MEFKLLMISGFGAKDVALKKRGAFFDTLSGLKKSCNRIDVLSPGKKWWFSRSFTVQVFDNVYIHTSPYPLWLFPFWILKRGKELAKINKYSVMTVQEQPPFLNGYGAKLLNRKTGIPYIIEIFHIPGHPKYATIKELIYFYLLKWFIKFDVRNASAVRVMNNKQVPDFLELSGVPREKIKYIPALYIDLYVFKPEYLEKKYDVIFVARLVKNKGVELLIEAVEILKSKNLDIKVLIVGEGPESRKIANLIKSKKLNNNIEMFGWAKDSIALAKLYNQSKILVIPSYNEGGPRVAFEAMACGIAVITTSVGIMNDIIQDGENGLFIDWRSSDIANKIMSMLSNQELLYRISSNGPSIAQKFEKNAMIMNYANSIRDIAKNSMK